MKIFKLHISRLLIGAFFLILILFPWYSCSSVEGAVYSEHLSLYWVHLVKCQGWILSDKTCDKPCVNISSHDCGQQRVVYTKNTTYWSVNQFFWEHRSETDDKIISTIFEKEKHWFSLPADHGSIDFFPICMYTNHLNIFLHKIRKKSYNCLK